MSKQKDKNNLVKIIAVAAAILPTVLLQTQSSQAIPLDDILDNTGSLKGTILDYSLENACKSLSSCSNKDSVNVSSNSLKGTILDYSLENACKSLSSCSNNESMNISFNLFKGTILDYSFENAATFLSEYSIKNSSSVGNFNYQYKSRFLSKKPIRGKIAVVNAIPLIKLSI
jgi:hypothetical protein